MTFEVLQVVQVLPTDAPLGYTQTQVSDTRMEAQEW